MSTSFFSFSWVVTSNLTYLQSCPEQLLPQVRTLINGQRLGDVPIKRYPEARDYVTDKAFRQYTRDLKNQFLCNALPINKVMYNSGIHVLKNALGLHTAVPRVQGGKLRVKTEIRVATVSRSTPESFLCMTVMYELTHLKEKEHNEALYQLRCRTESRCYQLRFDTRLWLAWLSLGQDKI